MMLLQINQYYASEDTEKKKTSKKLNKSKANNTNIDSAQLAGFSIG